MPGNISWKKFIQNFKKLGFGGPDISAGLVNEILRQADINKQEWNNLK